MTITRSGMTPEAIEELINRRVEEALAAHEATCAANALEAENQSQNGSNGDNGNGGNGDGENGNGGNGNTIKNGKASENETELLELNRENNDLAAYTQRFQELTMMCTKMVPEEEDRVEKFIGGLPDNIQGNVIAAKPTRLQDAVRIANNLMDQKLKGYAVKNVENKRRLERGQVVNQRVITYFECGRLGHYRSDCPKLKDQNRGNKAGNKNGVSEARGKAYVLGGGDANPDSNVVKDVSYAVELANRRISETNTVLRDCTLGFLGHPFNIDLMPVELGSFDAIIGMDWLANHQRVKSSFRDEKIGDEFPMEMKF
ncbi:reverse transcriptase domain-containing protein [Tanacetum coccineum]